MIIKFKHVTKSGRKPWERNTIQYGESKDEHTAVCNLYAFSLYEKAFAASIRRSWTMLPTSRTGAARLVR